MILWDKKHLTRRPPLFRTCENFRKLSYVVLCCYNENILVFFVVRKFCCCFLSSTWNRIDYCFPQSDKCKKTNFCEITFAATRKISLLGSQAVREQDIGPRGFGTWLWKFSILFSSLLSVRATNNENILVVYVVRSSASVSQTEPGEEEHRKELAINFRGRIPRPATSRTKPPQLVVREETK